jgi:hypothetical protein
MPTGVVVAGGRARSRVGGDGRDIGEVRGVLGFEIWG